ncbi:MAG: hypothetical protein EOO42_19035 [Flavobacteriales bacterium]|nr:MAG: hypothetical protein EOO42_19035 [Flavobacteriales bacterium]
MNQLDNRRWKEQLKRLSHQYSRESDHALLCKSIDRLAYLNNKNKSKHMIYYEASKIMSSRSRNHALHLYLSYLYKHPDHPHTIPLNAAMKKKFALDHEQIEELHKIAANFSAYGEVDVALAKVTELLVKK